MKVISKKERLRKVKVISKEELEELIESGKAEQVHFGYVEYILKPRGSLEKESLSSYILERLEGNYEFWTDPKYADNPELKTLIFILKKNLLDEVDAAWNEFFKRINSKEGMKTGG